MKFRCKALIVTGLLFIIIFSGNYSQGKKPSNIGKSTVELIEPAMIQAGQKLLFRVRVTHGVDVAGAEKGEWINKVGLALPTTDYEVDTDYLEPPDPMHGSGDTHAIDRWEVEYDPTLATFTWECFSVDPGERYGDIREGDSLVFDFTATIDDAASNGFTWTLWGDKGNSLTDTIFIDEPSDDDDDDNNDNDDDISPPPDLEDDEKKRDGNDDTESGCGGCAF